jgi:formiminotetrahydrofolate cyclodeaminase
VRSARAKHYVAQTRRIAHPGVRERGIDHLAVDAERAAAEGAGVASAGVVGAAAALVEMAARVSEDWPESRAALGQAQALHRRADALAAENARRYADVLRALESRGDLDLGVALDQAADIPLRIAETANDVALLAVHAADLCAPHVRPDVLAAAALAAGAAAAAAELVVANLTAMEGDKRVARVRDLAASARRSAGTVAGASS